jgi:hypothetical protein
LRRLLARPFQDLQLAAGGVSLHLGLPSLPFCFLAPPTLLGELGLKRGLGPLG